MAPDATEETHRVRRILPPIWLLIAFLSMIVLHFVLPVREVVSMPFNRSGSAFVVAGLSLFGWSVWRFHRAQTTIKPFEESSALITAGPYRVSRNPIYLAMVLLLAGTAILLGSLTPFVVVPLFALLIDRVFIRGEQRMLQTTFGDEYERYCRRVRRWI